MFPIRNVRGQIIGFGGRVLDSGEPKYLNSPETPIFRKGQELYGLFEAKRNPGKPKEIVVVEGYLDVASLVQFGVENVVATLGTAMTNDNIKRLTRLTDRVVFCFDGDRAGRAAAWRAMEAALPYGGGNVELKFLLLPEGDDPDTFVRSRGADAFRGLAATAVSLPEFLVKELDARVDFGNAGGRARFDAVAKPLLRRLPEGSYRETTLEMLRGADGHVARDFREPVSTDAPPPVVERPMPSQRRKARNGNSAVDQSRTSLSARRGRGGCLRAPPGFEPTGQRRLAPRRGEGCCTRRIQMRRRYWKICAPTPTLGT